MSVILNSTMLFSKKISKFKNILSKFTLNREVHHALAIPIYQIKSLYLL